ncbi:MAG: PAS domain S-box protein [Deltaproteobacteria bacterium]|nr:PAS domain S-box protein [bacterium]MCB9479887.1 PAS domain S-box protein [Deltaproteobacteria bacterium]MCB9489714.1 PAS domain S-box protein [Deltaproteobacteria bacterium]
MADSDKPSSTSAPPELGRIRPAILAGGILILLATLVILTARNNIEDNRREHENHTIELPVRLDNQVASDVRILELLAVLRSSTEAPSPEFMREAQNFTSRPDFTSLVWLTSEAVAHWTEPNITEVGVPGQAERRLAVEAALKTHGIGFTPVYADASGRRVFDTFMPVYRDGALAGMIGATRTLEGLYEQTLKPLVGGSYHMAIFNKKGQEIFAEPLAGSIDNEFTQDLRIPGTDGLVLVIQRYGTSLWTMELIGLLAFLVLFTLILAWGMWAVRADMTFRIHAEDALQRSEQRYRMLAENITDVIWTMDLDGNLTYVSPSITRILGYTWWETKQLGLRRLLTDESYERAVHVFDDQMKDDNPLAHEEVKPTTIRLAHLHKDGYPVWCEVTHLFLRDANRWPIGLIGVTRDITDQKATEDALRLSEERWRSLVDNAPDIIGIVDRQYRLTFTNRYPSTGGAQAALGKDITLLMPEEYRSIVRDRINYVFETGRHATYEVQLPNAQGVLAWFTTRLGPIFRDDRVDAVTLISTDVTDRMRTETELKESEEKFRSLAEQTMLGIVIVQDDHIKYVNPIVTADSGFGLDLLVGQPVESLGDLIHPDDREFVLAEIKRAQSGRGGDDIITTYRYINSREDTIWVEQYSRTVIHEGRPADYLMIMDITDRKLAEQKLYKYQRQLRDLSSQVAMVEERERRQIASDLHDRIGQNLALLKIKLSSLKSFLSDGQLNQPLGDMIKLVNLTIKDTRTLTFELSPPILYELGLGAAVEWYLDKIQEQHGIETEFEGAAEGAELPEELRVILFRSIRELIVNATKHAQAKRISVDIRIWGNELLFVVQDDGVGFDLSILESAAGGETGFGLFNVRERLEYLGGQVEIHSTPGKGTQISFVMPLRTEYDVESERGHERQSYLS